MEIIIENLGETVITDEMKVVLLQLEIDLQQDLHDLNPRRSPKYSDVSEIDEEEQEVIWSWFSKIDDITDHQQFMIKDSAHGIVGIAEYRIIHTEEGDLVHPTIKILRSFQRQGYGRAMWQYLIEELATCKEVEVRAKSTITKGKLFIESLGFRPIVEQVSSLLYMENAQWQLYQQWIDKVDQENFSTMVFQECPEYLIDEFCEFYNVIKSYSHSRLILGNYQLDPKLRRQYEREYGMEAGYDWTTIIVLDHSGKIIGMTETYVEIEGTEAYQELTGILPLYRGKGLAKWIKALMMLRIKERYPQLETIRTSNWRVNDESTNPIIGLNTKIGYEELFSTTYYRLKM